MVFTGGGGGGGLTLAASAWQVRRPPAGEPPPADGPPPPPRQTVVAKVVADQRDALLHTPPGLHQLYATCFLYGIAYGQLAAITGPYDSTSIFREAAGTSRVVKWTARGTALNLLAGLFIDGLAPGAAAALGTRASRWMWPSALLVGAGLFGGLAITSSPTLAVVLITAHAVVIGAHSFFSWSAPVRWWHPPCGPPPLAPAWRPRLRATW